MRLPDHVEHTRASAQPSLIPNEYDTENEGFAALMRDATDGLVGLVAAHFKLANLDLVADLRALVRELVIQVLFGLVALVGYALLMIGVALAAQPLMSLPLAFVLLGAFHIAAAGIAAAVLASRRKRAFQIEKALDSVGDSVTRVADSILGAPGHTHVRN